MPRFELPPTSAAEGAQIRSLHAEQPFAEVTNADLRAWLAIPDVGKQKLRALLAEHGLLLFRGVDLSPREEVLLTKLAGHHEEEESSDGLGKLGGWNAAQPGIGTLPQETDVLCQGNVLLKDHHGIASLQLKLPLTYESEGFHADGIHNMQHRLPVLTSMLCLKAPIAGGSTFFTCSRRALSTLDPALRELCRRLTVHYAYDETRGRPIMRDGIVREGFQSPVAGRDASAAPPAPVVRTAHPLVRRVAATGEESLYLSCANIERMEAPADERHGLPAVWLDEAQSYDLVRQILGSATAAPRVYEHSWMFGDLALWDNRIVLHAPGKGGTCEGERLHHRVRLDGAVDTNVDLIEHTSRRHLAAAHTLSHHFGFDELTWNHISARLPHVGGVAGKVDGEGRGGIGGVGGLGGGGVRFIVTPGDRLFNEVTPLNLSVSSPSNVNVTADVIHAAIYNARPDVHAIVHHHTPAVVAVACLAEGLQLLTQDGAAFLGRVAYHEWEGVSDDYDEKEHIASSLGQDAHTLIMRHHGAVTCGKTVAEAWVRYFYLDRMCQAQLLAMGAGGTKPPRQPPAAVLARGFEQLGPGSPYCHGKFEWDALLRLADSLQAGKAAGTAAALRPALAASPRLEGGSPTPMTTGMMYAGTTPEALKMLEEKGFCVIPGVIPSDDVGAIRASVMHTTAVHRNPNAPPTIGHVPGLIKHDQSFAPYLASRKVMDVVEAIFGTHAKITFTTGQTNHPGCERQEWHSDWPFNQSGNAHLRAPYVNATIHLTALYMLDEMTAENGTILLPGTHRAKVNPSVPGVHDPSSPHPREQRATGTAGSVLILDSRLWHCIPPNPTNASRVAFAVRYAPWL